MTRPATVQNAGLGILLMLVTYAFFAGVDTSVKWLVTLGIPALQLAFMRYFGQFILTLGAMARHGMPAIRIERHLMMLSFLRAALLMSATVLNFFVLKYLSLTLTSAILFASPIVVSALSGPLLGEKVGPWRWFAIVLGFVGVLVIVRPFSETVHWTAILMLWNPVAFGLFSILTRRLSDVVETDTLQFHVGALGSVILLPFAILTWQNPENLRDWILLFGIGFWAWAGHEIFIRAHRFAPASTLMPYTYSLIIYMTATGVLIFGDIPDALTILGAAIIVSAGLLIWWRERARARRVVRPVPQ